MGRTVEYTMHFTYDANGTPMTVTFDYVCYMDDRTYDAAAGAFLDDMEIDYTISDTYYYITNIQGDVIELLNSDGESAGYYRYDAWGNDIDWWDIEEITYYNPLRYRGYIYDRVSGYYYLQTRFYDASVGRFISADAYVSTGQGVLGNNMFAYCLNNPVNLSDCSGKFAESLSCIAIAIVAAIVVRSFIEMIFPKAVTPTSISEDCLLFIADYETYHSEPYDDGFGNLTVGYGHLIKNNESFSYLTPEQARDLLRQDVGYWEKEVYQYSQSCGVAWDQQQYDAFVSLAFNCGYYYRGVMDLIVSGESPHSAFSRIIYAGGNPVLGLYRRRMDEADMFVYGTYKRTYRGWP